VSRFPQRLKSAPAPVRPPRKRRAGAAASGCGAATGFLENVVQIRRWQVEEPTLRNTSVVWRSLIVKNLLTLTWIRSFASELRVSGPS
jgi:hypothetical protein